jgi:hypothetical protein
MLANDPLASCSDGKDKHRQHPLCWRPLIHEKKVCKPLGAAVIEARFPIQAQASIVIHPAKAIA